MTSPLPAGSVVLLVDGTCIFCNRLVSFILRRDRRGIFYFAHLQGELATTFSDDTAWFRSPTRPRATLSRAGVP